MDLGIPNFSFHFLFIFWLKKYANKNTNNVELITSFRCIHVDTPGLNYCVANSKWINWFTFSSNFTSIFVPQKKKKQNLTHLSAQPSIHFSYYFSHLGLNLSFNSWKPCIKYSGRVNMELILICSKIPTLRSRS